MTGGTYTLLLRLPEDRDLEVGALGIRSFDAGWYAYTGSAFGPGGFARFDRHRRVAREGTESPHWHVDYLLPETSVEAVYTLEGREAECSIARSLPGTTVPGFGASDCGCDAHLAYAPDPAPLREALEDRYRA